MTVNDLLEVQSVDWQALDVVRWAALDANLTSLDDKVATRNVIRNVLSKAVEESDGRLLAVRITLIGATALHGSLHREAEHWRAEIHAMAQDYGDEAVWIEQIKIATSPIYDLSKLAERDALTKVVLETLTGASQELESLPEEIAEMLNVLPPEVRQEVEREWEQDRRVTVMDDVRAIILESLVTKGGTEA